jgi:hypothetical protein
MVGIRSLVSIACILGCVDVARAVPITYNFSGSLDRPIDGASSFSGSLSFDNGTPGLSSYYEIEGQSGATATLQIGPDLFHFSNSMAQPANVDFIFLHSGSDSFSLSATDGVPASNSVATGASLWIDLSGAHTFPSDGYPMPTLNLNDFPSREFRMSVPGFSGSSVSGTLRSFRLSTLPPHSPSPVPTPAPEPTTLAVFTLMGIGLAIHRSVHRAA